MNPFSHLGRVVGRSKHDTKHGSQQLLPSDAFEYGERQKEQDGSEQNFYDIVEVVRVSDIAARQKVGAYSLDKPNAGRFRGNRHPVEDEKPQRAPQ